MGKRKKKKGRNKRKKNSNSTSIDIESIWPSEDKKDIEEVPTIEEPPPPPQEQEFPPNMPQEEIDKIKEQQGQLHLKLKRLMLKFDISQKNMDKAAILWVEARKLKHCDKIPNPAEWILNHEHLTKYWTDLLNQAKEYAVKNKSVDIEIPLYLALVLDKNSEISKYMNYFYKYFVD